MKIGNLSLAAAFACLVMLEGCKPKTPNTEPVADTETESAVDAAWATYVIADVEQVCGFVAENQLDEKYRLFYLPVDGQEANFEAVRDTSAKQIFVTWRNGPVPCKDGRKREGTLQYYYYIDKVANPDADVNSRYYRDYGFVSNVSFSNYFVDGWELQLQDPGNRGYIYNLRKKQVYTNTELLSFRIGGKFVLKHPTDATKDIYWEGELYKTIKNSSDNDIFDKSAQKTINWVIDADKTKPAKAAVCEYYGKAFGKTSNGKPFKIEINQNTPLVRDFLCTADVVASVTTNTAGFTYVAERHHPFISGIASFTTGTTSDNLYPRQIYFGNEATPEQDAKQCDNTGVVNIKGNYYPINFRK